jgi:neurofibromin 1
MFLLWAWKIGAVADDEDRSLILLSICERARLPCNAEGLRFINGYLESRLLLLTSIPVRKCNTHCFDDGFINPE